APRQTPRCGAGAGQDRPRRPHCPALPPGLHRRGHRPVRLETERLILREWEERDRDAYARFVSDPVVRRFYPSVADREESDRMIDRFIEGLKRDGYGLLAVERKADGLLIGDVGIIPVGFPIRGNPPVEIGWLLGQEFWGQGYAPEAARAWLDYAFDVLKMPEVVAWT